MIIHLKPSLFVLFLVSTWVGACDNTAPTSDPLPYAPVNAVVYMNTLQSQPLNTPTGYIYISGGLKGIIVYCYKVGNYYAIERESPDVKHCQVKVDITKTQVRDTCSNSIFNPDGTFISGTAGTNLRQYNVNFDGSRILITN